MRDDEIIKNVLDGFNINIFSILGEVCQAADPMWNEINSVRCYIR